MQGSMTNCDTKLRTWVRVVSRLGACCGVALALAISNGCVPPEGPGDGALDGVCTGDNSDECSGTTFCAPLVCNADGVCEAGADACPEGETCNETDSRCEECGNDGQDACDDGNVCTDDACTDGRCTTTAVDGCCNVAADCDDSDVCTTDACGDDNTCSSTAVDGCCNLDTDCADGETCVDNACVSAACTDDVDCPDDGTFCNGDESCDLDTGDCVSSGDPCAGTATPVCDEANGACVECLDDTDCDEAAGETCADDSTCVTICVDAADCDDGDLCTDDSCDADTLICVNASNCVDDGAFCNGAETCDPAVGDCVSAGDPCAAGEVCNEDTDACDDAPDVPFTVGGDVTAAEGDTGTTDFVFTVTRNPGDTAAKTLNFAVTSGGGAGDANAADFSGGVLPTGTVSWLADESGDKTITIIVNGDTTVEPDEGFTLTVTDPDDSDAVVGTAAGSIINDDTGSPPVNTVPTDASSQVGQTVAISGVSVADADNSTLSVNLSTADGLIQYTAIAAGASAVDENNQVVAAATNHDNITLSGTIANINATLTNLAYTTDRVASNPGTDIITMTSTDSDGGEDIDDINVAVGILITLTGAADTGATFVGTAGGDNFNAPVATDWDLDDILNGGDGQDQMQINAFGNTGDVPAAGTGGSVASIESAFLSGATGGAGILDLTTLGGLDTVLFTPAAGNSSAGDLLVSGAPDAFTFIYRPTAALNDFGAARDIDIGIRNATFGSQSYTLRLEGNGTEVADFVLLSSTAGSIETVNVYSTASDGTAVDTITNAMSGTHIITSAMNFSGDQKLNAGTWTGATVLNGAAMEAALTITASTAGATITGGSKGDTLSGGAGAQSISGGAGADTINPGAAADLVQTGTGADTIVVVNGDIAAAGGAVVYDRWQDFTTGSGGDALDYNTALNVDNTPAGPPFATANYTSGAITDTFVTAAAANVVIFEFTGAALANAIVPGTTTSGTIEGWAGTALATVDHTNAADEMIFIMYDTGTGATLDAAILRFSGDATLTGILAAELQLLAVVEGVVLDSFTFDNVK